MHFLGSGGTMVFWQNDLWDERCKNHFYMGLIMVYYICIELYCIILYCIDMGGTTSSHPLSTQTFTGSTVHPQCCSASFRTSTLARTKTLQMRVALSITSFLKNIINFQELDLLTWISLVQWLVLALSNGPNWIGKLAWECEQIQLKKHCVLAFRISHDGQISNTMEQKVENQYLQYLP